MLAPPLACRHCFEAIGTQWEIDTEVPLPPRLRQRIAARITVTLHLRQGLIEQVRIQTPATDPTSLGYQRAFAEAVPRVVEGKPLGEVKVGKLAGASGCPVGFNDALARIRQQAAQ